ncbi:MAG: hypothetical protein ACFE96_05165 [Candidatus Hermodarchaeota archaeon]
MAQIAEKHYSNGNQANFCPNCGTYLDCIYKFCVICGENLKNI